MKVLLPILLGLTCSYLPAQEKEPAIPPAAVKTALQWMLNADPAKRAAAYRTFQLFGDEGGEIYRRTLEKARELHGKKLGEILDNDRTNPFVDLPELSEEIAKERARIYVLIKTDYKKKPDKIKMLQDEVESLAKLNKKARQIAEKKSDTLDSSVKIIATALSEVMSEISIIDEDGLNKEDFDFDMSLKAVYEGEVYLKISAALSSIRKESTDLAAAKKDNDAAAWSKGSQREFTHHLNEFRSLFALTPLRMEEKLSDAAVGHSSDMATIGFFAHQSPVKGKKSPGDRARLAGFKHRWSGENIFAGSTSPIAAYNAWFGSDGHRFIMFARGPNLIGIGPVGKHWTMMTGSK